MKTIKLTQNKFAIVDDEDFDKVSKIKWCAYTNRTQTHWYSCSSDNRNIKMHRFILGLKKYDGLMIDHINGNGLDNRKCNLRICSHAENMRNSKKRKIGTSKYKGVTFCKLTKRWKARIVFGREYWIGRFDAEVEAAKAYDKKAKELFGEFANCNF